MNFAEALGFAWPAIPLAAAIAAPVSRVPQGRKGSSTPGAAGSMTFATLPEYPLFDH